MLVIYHCIAFTFSFQLFAAHADIFNDCFSFPDTEAEDFDIEQFLNFSDDRVEQPLNQVILDTLPQQIIEIQEDKSILEIACTGLDNVHMGKQKIPAAGLSISFTLVCQNYMEISEVSYQCLSISQRLKSLADGLIRAENFDGMAKISLEGFEHELMSIVIKYMLIEIELRSKSSSEADVLEKLIYDLSNDNNIVGKNFHYILNIANFLKCNLLFKALKEIEAQRNAPPVAYAFDRDQELGSLIPSFETDVIELQKKDSIEALPKKKISKRKRSEEDSEEKSPPKKRAKVKKAAKIINSDDDSKDEAPSEPRQKKENQRSASRLLNCKHSGCKYIAKSQNNLISHQKSEHAKCPHPGCDFSDVKKKLSKHYREKHPESSFVSEVPKKVSDNNLSKAKFKRTKERRFVCKYFGCLYTTDKKSHFDRHQRNRHIPCPYSSCDFFLQKTELSKHCKEVHKTGHFICSHPGCEFITDHKRAFNAHKAQIHYKCSVIGCEFSSSLNFYDIHKKTAHLISEDN